MPLAKGSSRKTVSKNIAELHGGTTYRRTKAKKGKEAADKQAIAIALNEAGLSRSAKRRRQRRRK